MPHVIRSFKEATADWLEEAFSFDPGSVSSCGITREWDTLVTHVALVHLDYRAAAPGKPTSVFMKIAKQNQDRELKKLCAREVLFYSQIAGLLPAQCIPRCYLAVHDGESDDFCIILEDLSASHLQTEYPVPPSIDWCLGAARCLAQIHAAGWNHGELGPVLGRFHTREAVEYWSGLSRQVRGEFSRFLADRLSDGRRRVVEKVMENIEQVFGRTLKTEQQTILHRDTHLWNFFFPKDERGDVKMFDWQLCDYGMAADDLVPMIALLL